MVDINRKSVGRVSMIAPVSLQRCLLEGDEKQKNTILNTETNNVELC